MKNRIVDFNEGQLREIFLESPIRDEDVEQAIREYFEHRENEVSGLESFNIDELRSIGSESIGEFLWPHLKDGFDIVEEIVNRFLQRYKAEEDT